MIEEKSPLWVHCSDCKNEWIAIYTPAPVDEVSQALTGAKCGTCQSDKICMGVFPKTIGIAASASSRDKIMAWLASGDTGISSESLAYEFLGQTRGGRSGAGTPSDPSDLGRCLRLINLVPEVRACVDYLALKHDGWKKAAKCWDAITDSMIDEVGIDWSKGRSAPKTYDMMKKAGL